MIAKEFRLSEREFRKVLQQKKPFFSYHLTIHTQPNKLPYPRMGILLSGKQVRGSVERNRLRRMLYDTCFPRLHTQWSHDYVISLSKKILLTSLTKEAIEQDIVFYMRKSQKSPIK